MSFQYLIRTLLLLLPFYLSAEILYKKPIKNNPYEASDRESQNSNNMAIAEYFLIFIVFAIHIANKILEVKIISLQFGLLFFLMCAVCSLYTIFCWYKVE